MKGQKDTLRKRKFRLTTEKEIVQLYFIYYKERLHKTQISSIT